MNACIYFSRCDIFIQINVEYEDVSLILVTHSFTKFCILDQQWLGSLHSYFVSWITRTLVGKDWLIHFTILSDHLELPSSVTVLSNACLRCFYFSLWLIYHAPTHTISYSACNQQKQFVFATSGLKANNIQLSTFNNLLYLINKPELETAQALGYLQL